MRGPFMPDVPIWEDFPRVGYVKWAEIQQIASELKDIDINKLVEGHDTWTQGALRECMSGTRRLTACPKLQGKETGHSSVIIVSPKNRIFGKRGSAHVSCHQGQSSEQKR
jgi:hypothetical protein